MSTASYLATFGVTMDQAREFVFANLNHPDVVAQVARTYGVTSDMLGEIAGGYSAAQVQGFFAAYGMNVTDLDAAPLFPGEMMSLSGVIALDTETGALSVVSLRGQVMAQTGQAAYQRAFDPAQYAGAQDGVFTPAETGIERLGNLPATSTTLESLFYGSIIQFASTIDLAEGQQIMQFVSTHQAGIQNEDLATFLQLLTLLSSIATTPAAAPFLADSQVESAAVASAVALVGAAQSNEPLFDNLLAGFRDLF